MSTWNVITIARHDGKPIDVDRLNRIVRYAADLSSLADGSSGYPAEFDHLHPNVVTVDGHTKWSVGADWAKLSGRLGPHWTIEHYEEWDDEEPGGADDVWRDGKLDRAASSTMRWVNDALADLVDVSKPPPLLTWGQVYSIWKKEPGTTFIAVPPKPEGAAS